MKQLFSIIILAICSLSTIAQSVGILDNENGQPSTIFLKLPDTTYIHHLKDGQIPDHLTFDDKYIINPKTMFDRGPYDNHSILIDNLDSIEPGILPEGDLPYKIKYTADGQRLIVAYHHSNNVYIYDTETNETLGIVNVGLGPEDMAVTDQHIYVCCYYSNDIYVINLDDYSIESRFSVEPQPCVIKVNDEESKIFIGFTSGEHDHGFFAAYDLSSFEQIFESQMVNIQQINLSGWGWVGRKVYYYSNFLLVADDNYIATLLSGYIPMFMDPNTGEIVATITLQGHSSAITKSLTGDTLFALNVIPDTLIFYCIDAYAHQVLDSIMVPSNGMVVFWGWSDGLVVNNDGTKLFIETGEGLWSNVRGFMVDFSDHSYVMRPLVGWEETQFDAMLSYDGRYVIIPGLHIRVFDFETEDYVCNQWETGYKTTKVIAISPDSYEFIWCDHMSNYQMTTKKKDEYIDFYDFSDPTTVVKSDSIFCGQKPEADLTYNAALNNKYGKIVTANPLSANISIIDATTYEIDTILDIEHIGYVKNVTDDLMVLTGVDSPYILLFDVSTLSVVKELPNTNRYLDAVIPSPDQLYFYTYSRFDDQLSKFHLDGSNTQKIDSLEIPDTFVHNITWDLIYTPEISPDGGLIMLQNGNNFQIVHTGRMDLECTIPSDKYVFDMAFTPDSKRVGIAHGIGKPHFTIIYLDGPNSFMEHNVQTGTLGGYGAEYNPVDQKFYFARTVDVLTIDPVSGLIEDTLYLGVQGYQMQIGIDPNGIPVVQTERYLHYNDQGYYLREYGRLFTVDNESYKCILPRPGPDNVFVLDFLTSEIHELPTSMVDDGISIYPNPTNDRITIKSGRPINRIEIFNSGGEKLFDKNFNNAMTTLSLAYYPRGVYFIKVQAGTDVISKKLVLTQ